MIAIFYNWSLYSNFIKLSLKFYEEFCGLVEVLNSMKSFVA